VSRGGDMFNSLVNDEASLRVIEPELGKSDVERAVRASRAFAIKYINEIFRTIISMDPKVINKLKVTKQYPYSLYVFIHQEKPQEIDQLDIYMEKKNQGDGCCEVKEIYHSSKIGDASIEDKQRCLMGKCSSWSWNSLPISKMNALSLSEGRKIAQSLYDDYNFSAVDTSLNSLMSLLE
jgi:hypothetical protein